MKLTNNQIKQLYTFTRDHFVYHFDLQTELVDHLANGIERTLEKKPALSFESALQIEFKKFGVFGFQDVVEKRKKALNKKYWKIIFTYYKKYFSLPKIILTAFLTFFLFTLLNNISLNVRHYCLIGLFICFLIPIYIQLIKLNRYLKKRERKWLFEEILLTQMGLANLFLIPIHILNIKLNLNNTYILGVTSFFVVVTLLLFHVMVFKIPKKAEKLLEETYPEYKMMNT
ncbi:hypothetical protein KO500_05880 [Cellulophaga baltica]|uniref:hypothetical protein n=1 Tax=Cellulophaga TaxID=104264 RepID=UPI001C07C6D4|nr:MULTISPECIES: hypothetical protein [Cellulophaga]MBU2995951.1 hypothetical protein [Cellulophaga baltica]MDO6767346.1 hypothetical protein [Cellulophaga sp. 1_MG-2023]